ncbi:MAG: V-type proton ATPase subunit E [Chlamydiae bacterium]|nr:V-type proton ATPase subunit E [Chlamydiota bacterium]
MDTLEKGKNKLGEICDILRKETLEPAQNEAHQIINSAKQESQKVIEQAKSEAKQLLEDAKAKIAKEQKLFESSMDLGSKQTFNQLREKIQKHLFNDQLAELTANMMGEGELVAKLISAIVNALEKDGLNSNLTIALANSIKAEDVSKTLVAQAAEKIKKGKISIESISSGAKVSIEDQKVSIDVSDQSLKELMGNFLRDSFREILFKNV